MDQTQKHKTRTSLVVALFVAGVMGCESVADLGPRTEVRDSVGITIVENAGDVGPDGGGWLVGQDPVLSIGTFQGDSIYQLFQVEGAKRLQDGRIAVSNAGSGEIRIFDVEGRFLMAHGRKGKGLGSLKGQLW
jgi:hypothetical protein